MHAPWGDQLVQGARDAHAHAPAYNGIYVYISEWPTQQANQRAAEQAPSAHVHIPGRPT